MFRPLKSPYRVIFPALHGMVVAGSAIGAYAFRHDSLALPQAYVLTIALATIMVMALEAIHPSTRGRQAVGRFLALGAGLIGLAYYLKSSDSFSRLWSIYWVISASFLLLVLHAAIRKIPGLSADLLGTILIGPAEAREKVKALFQNRRKYILAEMEFDQSLSWLNDHASGAKVGEIVIVGALPSARERAALVMAVHGHPARIDYFMAPDLPMLSLLPPYSRPQLWCKRALDVILASLLLCGALPLFLAIGLAIKLDDRGPILFRQRRLGLGGQSFHILKFRTMKAGADSDPNVTQATSGDSRITWVGRLLRIWSLDELPQLVNVIRGDMSLVGPRPHAFAHDVHYSAHIDNYPERLHVRPGITGLAQISGSRGETPELADMQRRIDLDVAYVRDWSLWLDLKILLSTFPALLSVKAGKDR